MALRQSIGDGDTSTLIDNTEKTYKILVWILWFMILVVGNVVFMNFIIAVVNEGYAECAETKDQCIQIAKLEMI
jgi:heme/copper-type cytochrome/quinol oxidase subunit 2